MARVALLHLNRNMDRLGRASNTSLNTASIGLEPLMNYSIAVLLSFSLLLTACSEPECLPSEERVGNVCRVRVIDAGACETGESADSDSERDSEHEVSGEKDASTPEIIDAGSGAHTSDAGKGDGGKTDSGEMTTVAATCGNSVVEPGEDCDGNCPTTCPDADEDACTRPVVKGTGCNRVCGTEQVTEKARDFCCVPGEHASEDGVCPCGNWRFDLGEECDDANMENGDGCTADCKLEDRAGTPGDDRYSIACGANSCPRGEQCIVKQGGVTPYTCKFHGATGGQDTEYSECDGPEDCFSTQTCAAYPNDPPFPALNYWVKCQPNDEIRRLGRASAVFYCHTDLDCPIGERCTPDTRFKGYGICVPAT